VSEAGRARARAPTRSSADGVGRACKTRLTACFLSALADKCKACPPAGRRAALSEGYARWKTPFARSSSSTVKTA
jgi:hypothetical protein